MIGRAAVRRLNVRRRALDLFFVVDFWLREGKTARILIIKGFYRDHVRDCSLLGLKGDYRACAWDGGFA